MGLTTFPDLPTRAVLIRVMPIRLGSAFPGAARRRRVPKLHRHTQQRTFWLWPISRFGHSMVTQVQSAVHLHYPYGTSLAPPPHFCLQCLTLILADCCHRLHGGPLLDELHTEPLPALHVILGYSWSYMRSRHPMVSHWNVTRQIRACAPFPEFADAKRCTLWVTFGLSND